MPARTLVDSIRTRWPTFGLPRLPAPAVGASARIGQAARVAVAYRAARRAGALPATAAGFAAGGVPQLVALATSAMAAGKLPADVERGLVAGALRARGQPASLRGLVVAKAVFSPPPSPAPLPAPPLPYAVGVAPTQVLTQRLVRSSVQPAAAPRRGRAAAIRRPQRRSPVGKRKTP